MSKRLVPFLLCIVAALLISSCGGGSDILDLRTPFSTSSSGATLDNVGRTIITASAYKGWQPQVAGPGRIIASRHYAGRVAKVAISYTSNSFNITYIDSDNLGYNGKSISSTYSDWVEDLRDEIKRRLSNL